MFPDSADVSAHLADGRAAALALMVDTCRITKPGAGKGPLNEETGQYDEPAPITVYEGPCRMQIRSDVNSNVVDVTAGEREWAYQTAILNIPVLALAGGIGDPGNVRVDHTVTYLTAAEDPDLAGRVFQIRANLSRKTYATARRLRVTEAVA